MDDELTETQADEARLPKKIRDRLTRLRTQLWVEQERAARAEQQLRTLGGTASTSVYAQMPGDDAAGLYLPNGSEVTFMGVEGLEFTVSMMFNELMVESTHRLVVCPTTPREMRLRRDGWG